MSFSLGGSKSSSKSKSKSNNSIDPKSLELFGQSYNPALAQLGQVQNTPYGGALGAGLDPLQQQGAQMAQANAGVGQSQIGQATGIAGEAGQYTPGQVHAGTLSGMDYSQYMNPYLSNVLDSTMGAIDLQRQRSLVGNSQAAGPGAWGGSRHGVADSLTNEAALREASSAANNIYSQGFGQAQQAGQFDINNQLGAQQFNVNSGIAGQNLNLNAANSLSSFGQAANQMGANDATLINGFGQQAQATQQNQNQMAYDEWLRQQGIPLELAAAYGSLAGTVPIVTDNQSHGSQSGYGLSAGFKSSDARLKTDVEYVLTDGAGRDWFDYRYVWQDADEPKQRGVMAQQILETDPHAVAVDRNGFLAVDYGALH